MRGEGARALTLKPLHLDVEYRYAFGQDRPARKGDTADQARTPNVDDEIIRAVAPVVLAAQRHSSHEKEALWTSTVPPLSPSPKAVQSEP